MFGRGLDDSGESNALCGCFVLLCRYQKQKRAAVEIGWRVLLWLFRLFQILFYGCTKLVFVINSTPLHATKETTEWLEPDDSTLTQNQTRCNRS